TGHLVYAVGEKVMAVPFDVNRLEVTGKPSIVIAQVRQAGQTATSQFSFSETGALAFLAPEADFQLALVDMKGVRKTVGGLPLNTFAPRLSPSVKQLAFDRTNNEVWIYELSGDAFKRLRKLDGNNRFPMWSGDGQRLLYISYDNGDPAIFWQRA